MSKYFIGIISGTSFDGVDVALVRFDENSSTDTIASHSFPIPSKLVSRMQAITVEGEICDLQSLGVLDHQFGELFAESALSLLETTDVEAKQVTAIGCHGQTIFHAPDNEYPFTMQIGDPNRIAARTGITTIADFRRRDMALGGQGAPLVPAYHAAAFSSPDEHRVILNIGGISNITVLDADHVRGFDTGPGNALLDAWHQQHNGYHYDKNGQWASGGKLNTTLMKRLMADDYFERLPPKSTGKEYFNLAWLTGHLLNIDPPPPPQDVQSTLAELTARTIADSILSHASQCKTCITCGGGTYNKDLMQRLQSHLPGIRVTTTTDYGVDPDLVEAVAFAWLARQTMEGKPGNVSTVTGATHDTVLGAIYPVA